MSTQFLNLLKHNKDSITPLMSSLANYTFESVAFADGTLLKDVTFAELYDVVWSNTSKSSAVSFSNSSKSTSPTWANSSKS